MDTTKDNHIEVIGYVCDDLHFSHSLYGERFYQFFLRVPRLSKQFDILPVTISRRMLRETLQGGSLVRISGQIRSYNQYTGGLNRLILTLFAKHVRVLERTEELCNMVILRGFICKETVYRTTPFRREIADMLLAVNRTYNKSDYIPCIAWGRNARNAADLAVGDELRIQGRMQSREYEKQHADGRIEKKTAYEISVFSIRLLSGRTQET